MRRPERPTSRWSSSGRLNRVGTYSSNGSASARSNSIPTGGSLAVDSVVRPPQQRLFRAQTYTRPPRAPITSSARAEVTTFTVKSLRRGGVRRDVRGDVADLRDGEALLERRHAPAAVLHLRDDLRVARLETVEVRTELAGRSGRLQDVTRTAPGRLVDERTRGRVRVRRRRRRDRIRRCDVRRVAVEPDRARVPDPDEDREERAARDGQRPLRVAVQADDRHLRGESAVDRAAAQRVREHAVVRMLEAALEDAVVRDRQREREREPPRPPVHRVHPPRLPPRQLAEDPRRREELEEREDDGPGREARLQMHGVAEEEPEVPLRARVGLREEPCRERDERDANGRDR